MFQKSSLFGERNLDFHAALLREIPFYDLQSLGLEFSHYGRHEIVAESDLPAAGGDAFDDLRLLKRFDI